MGKGFRNAFLNSCVNGTGIIKTGIRKWYNPLRYIKGKRYRKSVKLEDVFR